MFQRIISETIETKNINVKYIDNKNIVDKLEYLIDSLFRVACVRLIGEEEKMLAVFSTSKDYEYLYKLIIDKITR
ncbi:MAG: hypothetical protein J6O56_02480 [Bacilli bacterium]|nr:hypothetical protein [Bacilli bacterium]